MWRLAKRVKPDLKVVGEIWCTSETCSEACTVLGREVAEELGIKLIEISEHIVGNNGRDARSD